MGSNVPGLDRVELLIAIAIVGILAAIALPQFGDARAAAEAEALAPPTVAAGAIDVDPVRDLTLTLLAVRAEQVRAQKVEGRFLAEVEESAVTFAPGISVAEYRIADDRWTLSLTHDAGVLCSMAGTEDGEVSLFCTETSRLVLPGE